MYPEKLCNNPKMYNWVMNLKEVHIGPSGKTIKLFLTLLDFI